ncbi:MAG: hypothetical protein FJ315_01455 [SAR202 cluster bacterium]|nr:hypothetical protein [SAR202 cluster bacterium]
MGRDQILQTARREALSIVDAAQQHAQHEIAESRRRGLAETAVYLERARHTREAEEEAMRVRLRTELADLTVLAATPVLSRSIDRRAHADLIAEAVRAVLALPPDVQAGRSALYARVKSAGGSCR